MMVMDDDGGMGGRSVVPLYLNSMYQYIQGTKKMQYC
jgi:hypothetical protein